MDNALEHSNVYQKTIDAHDPNHYCEAMSHICELPKSRIKDAMTKGAAWIQRPNEKWRRIRWATAMVQPGDRVALYYNASILKRSAPPASCIKDLTDYGIWYKPAGLMSQGNHYGDHCALLRQVEITVRPKRRALLVHRLDREASGLIILAHHRHSAAALSAMLQHGKVEKHYHAWVHVDVSNHPCKGSIATDLDHRPALTQFKHVNYDTQRNQSQARIQIITGRKHQIRRHFHLIGHPVMGDPRYGQGNKNTNGLQLVASSLIFNCPLGKGPQAFHIDPQGLQ